MIADYFRNRVHWGPSFRCFKLLLLMAAISTTCSIALSSSVSALSPAVSIRNSGVRSLVANGLQESVTGDTISDTLSIRKESEGDSTKSDQPARMVLELEEDGKIVIQLLPEDAPKTVERIVSLAEDGFYDGVEFHRVESYLVQAGRKECDVPPLEGEMFSQYLRHEEGMVGIARLPADYDSATNQFYICKKSLPRLNGEYTLFGKVTGGMDIIHNMEEGRKIRKAVIIR